MTIKTGLTVDPQLIANATASLMLVGTGERRVITKAEVFANNVGTLNLFYLPSGGAASNTTQTITKAMAVNETYIVSELIGKGFETSGDLQGNDGASGGAVMNIQITYTEYTGASI